MRHGTLPAGPPATIRRWRRGAIALVLAAMTTALLPLMPAPAAHAATGNLALGKAASVSSTNSPYVGTNLNDGDPSTYWESAGSSFPQWAQVDLGAATTDIEVALKPPASWGARTETLAVQGSTDRSAFSTIVASAGYTFDPTANNNTVTINFTA